MLTPLLLAALLAPRPAAASDDELPPSGIRVVVASAAVSGLDCRRRPFAWEDTGAVDAWVRSMAGGTAASRDPASILQGAAATLITAPMFVLAVPADLVSAPFRRVCTFSVSLKGKLSEWAGMVPPAGLPLEAEAVNLEAAEVPGVRKARFAVFKASTTTDAAGGYALSFPGQVGHYPALSIVWRVKGEPGGQLLLVKTGGVFVLSEPDPGFGVGAAEMDDMTIVPERKRR